MNEKAAEIKETQSIPAITARPYCQIANQKISPEQCLEMQGQEGCFGCAAPTKLCEYCLQAFVNVPAVGLCSNCLNSQLAEEERFKHLLGAPTITEETKRVWCQISKRDIAPEMCAATQGQTDCFNCTAPSRVCEKCKVNSVRFPQYGLCVHCSVEEYGDGWNYDSHPAIKAILPQELSHETAPKKDDEEIFMVTDNLTKKSQRKEKKKLLLPKARAFLRGREKVSASALATELHVRYEHARHIMLQLEEEGLVGPSRGSVPRTVLLPITENRGHSPKKPVAKQEESVVTTSSIIRKLESMITLFPGGDLEKTLRDVARKLEQFETLKEVINKIA